MKTQESGTRIKVRGTINALDNDPAIQWLVWRLSDKFGGCTVLPGITGYWTDGDILEREPATIIEVSWPRRDYDTRAAYRDNDTQVIEQVRALFATTQFSVGGDWCHIEVSEFEAAHCHHEHYACAKIG